MGLLHDLSQAAVIMTLGMVVTFAFLAVLIIMMQISSKIISKYVLETAPSKDNNSPPPPQPDENGALIAAITMAAKKYHSEHTKH